MIKAMQVYRECKWIGILFHPTSEDGMLVAPLQYAAGAIHFDLFGSLIMPNADLEDWEIILYTFNDDDELATLDNYVSISSITPAFAREDSP